MSASGTQSGPGGTITRSVIRAPATAQDGEALTLVTYAVASGRPKDKVVWLVSDSLSSAEALRAYHRSPKIHGTMSQIFSQALQGQPLRLEACVQVLVTPSHHFTIVNKGADWGWLRQPHLHGQRMFRRFYHFAPPEATDEVYQLGRKQTKALLLDRPGGLAPGRIFGPPSLPARAGWPGGLARGAPAKARPKAADILHLRHARTLPPMGTKSLESALPHLWPA